MFRRLFLQKASSLFVIPSLVPSLFAEKIEKEILVVKEKNTTRYYLLVDNFHVLHRENGPAVECSNGDKFWWIKGKLHRENGPACEYINVYTQWYKNGLLHREDGPAIEYANGSKEWYMNGLLHREDGPAVEYANGNKYWYINGLLQEFHNISS